MLSSDLSSGVFWPRGGSLKERSGESPGCVRRPLAEQIVLLAMLDDMSSSTGWRAVPSVNASDVAAGKEGAALTTASGVTILVGGGAEYTMTGTVGGVVTDGTDISGGTVLESTHVALFT
jgi:hypothetical protein